MFRVLTSPKHLAVERVGYRVMRVDPDAEQRWSTYLLSLLGFSLASVLVLFGLGRLQDRLPLDIGMAPLDPAGRVEHRGLVRHQHQLAVVLG